MGGWSVAAVLATYLVWGMLNREEDGRPRAPVSEETLFTVLFWTPVALAAAASAAGMLWTTRSYARREKPSLLWTRRAFAFGIVAAVVFAIVPRQHSGQWFIAWIAAAVVAAQSSLFAYAALREYRRTSGAGRGGHRSRQEEADEDDEGAS